MQLIGSLASPFVRKVRVVLAEKKLDCDFVLDNPWSPDTTLGQSNPLGQVPCLIMDGGEAVFDSRVIVEYLDTLSPVGKLIPSNGRERIEVKTWEALADGLADAAIAVRLERTWAGRSEQERSAAWIARKLGKVNASLQAMSTALGDKPFCYGVNLSLADIALVCALDWVDFRQADLSELAQWQRDYPNLAKLQERLRVRPSFVATAPRAA